MINKSQSQLISDTEAFALHAYRCSLDNKRERIPPQTNCSSCFYTHLPLDKVVVTSEFGIRKDPFTKRSRRHMGIDLKAKYGQKAYATLPGVISAVGRDKGRGIYVSVAHGDYIVTYCHLSRAVVRLHQSVNAGDVVGYVGSTGRSTGPHLHLSLHKGTKVLDPRILLKFLLMRIKGYSNFTAYQDSSATPSGICRTAI